MALLDSTITSTQLFVKIYMTFYGLKFKLEIMNMILQMINLIKKCHERTRKSSQTFLATKLLVTNENNYLDVAMKS